jgi:hypothetical protein
MAPVAKAVQRACGGASFWASAGMAPHRPGTLQAIIQRSMGFPLISSGPWR